VVLLESCSCWSFSITPGSLVALSILPRRFLGSVLLRSHRFGLGAAFLPFYKWVYLATMCNISCRWPFSE
ncbi:14385_t:CDS:2, partial [Gigaspora rosea]